MSSFHLRIKTCFENQLVQQTSPNNVKLCWTYPHHPKNDYVKRCAVLCCLKETADGQVLVLMTTRSDMVSSHPGNVNNGGTILIIIVLLKVIHVFLEARKSCMIIVLKTQPSEKQKRK